MVYYRTWSKELERYEVTSETLLVGHSCGAGFLVRWLSEHRKVRTNKIVLVAPWIDPYREQTTDFFEFEIDKNLVSRTAGVTIFHSDDDIPMQQASVQTLLGAIPGIKYLEFHNRGHFYDERVMSFPELLDELLSL